MTKTIKYILIISGVVIVCSTIGLFSMDKLFSPIIWFAAMNSFIIAIASIHLKQTNSARLYGGYLLGIMLIYTWINYEPNWYLYLEHYKYASRAILSLLLIGYGISQLLSGGKFEHLVKSKTFVISIILLTVFLLSEIPIYNIHGDFGGNSHGHNYMKGMHFH